MVSITLSKCAVATSGAGILRSDEVAKVMIIVHCKVKVRSMVELHMQMRDNA